MWIVIYSYAHFYLAIYYTKCHLGISSSVYKMQIQSESF